MKLTVSEKEYNRLTVSGAHKNILIKNMTARGLFDNGYVDIETGYLKAKRQVISKIDVRINLNYTIYYFDTNRKQWTQIKSVDNHAKGFGYIKWSDFIKGNIKDLFTTSANCDCVLVTMT